MERRFILRCSECQNNLALMDEFDTPHELVMTLAPCETCLENESDTSFAEGYEQGHEEGYKEGTSFAEWKVNP